MKSTLLIGDYLFVSKFSYGYSHHSLPFSPGLFKGRIFSEKPTRGDVAVFKLPRDNTTDYIKRVIGLPGDRIQMRSGRLFINGNVVPKKRIDDFIEVGPYGNTRRVSRYEEELPNGVKYPVLDTDKNGHFDNTGEFVVPAGHYFMMGDNRDNSTDSRAAYGVGYVPLENFVGRAEVIFFSSEQWWSVLRPWAWPTSVRWSRIFGLER